jgi:hypothetical protein
MVIVAINDHKIVSSSHCIIVGKYRKWMEIQEQDSTTPSFEVWVREAAKDFDIGSREESDKFLLSVKPSQRAQRYRRMKSYGNSFYVDDEDLALQATYNSGIASVFTHSTSDAQDVTLNYVGMLKDILVLDYGPIQVPIVLLRCEWIKRHDSRGNATYIRDEAGFLVVNFRHRLQRMSEPFIFPSQATQVFFSEARDKAGWKTVLRKDVRARREVVDTTDVFIATTSESPGLSAPAHVPTLPERPSLIGAIELSTEDDILASRPYI